MNSEHRTSNFERGLERTGRRRAEGRKSQAAELMEFRGCGNSAVAVPETGTLRAGSDLLPEFEVPRPKVASVRGGPSGGCRCRLFVDGWTWAELRALKVAKRIATRDSGFQLAVIVLLNQLIDGAYCLVRCGFAGRSVWSARAEGTSSL